MPNEPTDRWRIDTNDRYDKIVTSLRTLATALLVVPVLFLRDFLAVPKEKTLVPFLNGAAYAAWICLSLSILFGLVYSWLSVKWVKRAWGQHTKLSVNDLEGLLDASFVATAALFLLGVVSTVWFFATFRAPT